ncbi:MAG: hypothetical protein GQ574_19740 [Crocinitomix sp.]|nr:hypothetical protein [Crocinitomix sp.]
MQKLKFISGLSIFTVIFLMGCSGGSSTTDNEFLGEFPSIENNYANQLDEKEQEIDECTDFAEAFKLEKEKKLLKEEKKQAVEEYLAANPLNKELPFQALADTKYTINKVEVDKASEGNLNIKFLITINEDMMGEYGSVEQSLYIYYKALDSKGEYIAKSRTVAVNFKRVKLVSGTEYEVVGTWQNNSIRNMEDFAEIVEVTKEEYDKNS